MSVTVPITTLQTIAALPDGAALSSGAAFAANCIACHGANGEGTPLAPALNDPVIRTDRTADQLNKTVSLGSPGTVMAGWSQKLSAAEITDLVTLIQSWDQLPADAIPEPPAQPIIVTEKLLATGQTLYTQNCSRCHGTDGQGTRRAPALNVQSFFDKVTTDQAMLQIVSSGVPGTAMPAWGDRMSSARSKPSSRMSDRGKRLRPPWRPHRPPVVAVRRGSARATHPINRKHLNKRGA